MTKPPKPMTDKAELKLEHLAPYLPYGLKVKLNLKVNNIFTVIEMAVFVDGWGIRKKGSGGYFTNQNWYIKPILRPLSDLTKKDLKYLENSDPIELIGKGCIDVDSATRMMAKENLNNIQYLCKRHFDIHGLIDDGLAINVNTLSVNPYK